MSQQAKISIITVVYNAEAVVKRTMDSVALQTYQNIEHIIIDGASTDRTLEVISNYNRDQILVFSERDRGIYDAMNKGIDRSSGEYLIFMNAGDVFYDNQVLQKIMALQKADLYYGNTMVVDESGTELGDRRLHPPKKLAWRSLRFGMCVSHQSILVAKAVCEKYDLQYKISGDIDWLIRVLKKSQMIINTNLYVSKFLEGGLSATRRKQGLKERFAILTKHYGAISNYINHIFILMRFIWHRVTRNNMT